MVDQKRNLKTPPLVEQVEFLPEQDMVAVCRCGLSKNWPYCDGSHVNVNEALSAPGSEQSLGPLVVVRGQSKEEK